MKGYLIYNPGNERIGVAGGGGDWLRDGLHCGEPLEVFLNGEWIPTRIEKTYKWYLVGLPGVSLQGLPVRVR